MKKIITLLFVLASLQSFSQSTTVVISQVDGGGGGGTGTYLYDYVELHNVSNVTQVLTGYSIQYGAATGQFASTTSNLYAFPAGTSIPAGGYLLIQCGPVGSAGAALPTPDLVTGNLTMSAASGKVALANQATALGCGATATLCTLPSASIIDLVSYGAANNAEGGVSVNNGVAITSSQGCVRKALGCTDTDNNNADFDVVSAPVPRNSSSAPSICGGSSPSLAATSLTSFGSVCINTTVGPNMFTISGTNLTVANVTVGALAGFTYSTTSGGTYTTSLSLTHPAGTYSQDIYVKFTPTAVQSYNGNIPVGGGGVGASINVAAVGSGINLPVVTTAAATGITSGGATLPGTIVAIGCSAITAYGVEYSLTNSFPNGTGTAVPASNLSGGIFSSPVTGLAASTTYYYHAYATNTQGTGYSAQGSFTTSSATVPNVVISQIYGGGGNASATYNQDFVELFNKSTSITVDISGWSVQYASATGPTTPGNWAVTTIPAATTIAPGKYYLIALATGANGIALPTADLTNTAVNMSGTAGKVALVNTSTAINGTAACTDGTVVDVVGFGSTATCAEGTLFPATGITTAQAIFRKLSGCTDTNDNSADMELLSVNPRNSATAANICGLPVLSASALTSFGNVCTNTIAGPNSFTITGNNLTVANVTVAALAGFTYSTTAGGTYTTTLSLTQPGGSYSQQIFVKFNPTAVQSYNGNIAVGGGGAAGINVAAQGSGISCPPTLSATTLTAFGAQCINGTYGPNSFTITGTNLDATNVTVAALAGFTYSTTAGGTYTTTLSLTQPGGAYSQQIFVKFNPTAVQSYDGNIVVGGGGASAIIVVGIGSGVNSVPTVTSGAASAITAVSATVAGTINSIGCSAVSAYGVEYSTTNGFPNGTGTPVTSGNLAGGNFTSALSGLTPSTIYYYHAYATNLGGTGYGAQGTFTTATPGVGASALAPFGAVCINTTAGPNSFTINGSNLTTANVTVGALAGFTYSTTAGGTYTASLSLTQPGGTYSQQIFVKFTPTAVQSYNGSIVVGGGGASSSINVLASASGINSIPTLTTGGSSAITTVSATCAGTINSTGCSAVTAYGIEYSIIPGFANGTGTPVASTNLAGGNFTSDLLGLTPSTTYYYHAYATNGGGTGYGAEQFFTTGSLTPTLTATGLAAFGAQCISNTYGPNSFTINGSALTAANVDVAALAGFTYSITAGGTYTTTLSLTQPGGTYSQQIFVKFTPTAVQSYNGNIVISGGGAPTPANVAASGSGVNTLATVTTGAASAITSISATTAGSIGATGCTAVSAYGVEYSTTNGFPNGTGTAVASTNLAGGNFTSNLTGLTPSTTYYYHAYATNGGGTAYGAQQQFTTLTPALSASALTGFGNVCLNTTAGPNSFTITGTNLSAANVTVGPLTAYTFSTTSGGTYTASLSLTQPSGAYSQQIFVKFTPTAVQSYNGNIPIGGGGAATQNVAVTGAGVNTLATVTTGAASAITSISATCAGTIPGIGCSAVSAYGIEYSTTNGFPNGTGTAVASTNLTGINFSSNLTGLAPTTTYYYHAYATNSGGTAYGAQQQFTTTTPVLSASTLAGFGAVCLNATAGPNSFTITGTNLTTANVTVGPLSGFTFSTTSGGTYTASLSLTQPSGAYSQQIFVKFTPTAVQSYNGNIPVGGGGATTINVAASGSGINTMATVTSGAASAITPISATVAGTIPSIGCSAVTAYGIEYSTTTGFPNGTGTAVASTNLTGINFSSSLTGLIPSTTYYYHAYATNNGGTAYGAQGQFTTSAPVLTSTALTGFGAMCLNTTAGPNSFTINSTYVLAPNINVGPLNGYTFSTTSGGTYTTSLSLTHANGPYSQQIFVKFTPTAVQSYNGNIPVTGGGAPVTNNVAVTGSGINTVASVTTGSSTVLSPNSVSVNGTIAGTGCSPVITYGFEYSGINGFTPGIGTRVAANNLSGGNFSTTINGLVENSVYYYRAWATNNGGIAYGTQQTFTTSAIPAGMVIYSTPIARGGDVHLTVKDIKPGHYSILLFNSVGQQVFKKDIIIQVNFVDVTFTLPAILGTGTYRMQLINSEYHIEKTFMIW